MDSLTAHTTRLTRSECSVLLAAAMRWVKKVEQAVGVLLLAGVVSGCGDSEVACASGCPATGQAATDGDTRLLLDTENSSVVIEDESSITDGAIMKGELVIRPETLGCISSSEHPCASKIRRLTVTITDFALGDFTFTEPTLSIDAPLDVVDIGMGFPIEEGRDIHTCVTLRGARQHGVQKAATAANLLFDDGTSPYTADLGAWARLDAWWPLALALPADNCGVRTLKLVFNATFVRK